jgi:hypothetical protein
MMKFFVILMVILSFNLGCFGPVEPTHPLDEDTPIADQAKGSIRLTLFVPTTAEVAGYVSLQASRSPNTQRRLYLEDFSFKGNITESNGESYVSYSSNVNKLEPDIYGLYSFVPSLQFEETLVFELDPNGVLDLEIHLASLQ